MTERQTIDRLNARLKKTMQLSKQDIHAIRKRLIVVEGGIKATATKGGISEVTAHKILNGENVRQSTIDAFYTGLETLETEQAALRQRNSERAHRPRLAAH